MTAENAFSQWFKPGGKESAASAGQFMRLFGDQPDQLAAMRSAVMDRYYNDVIAKSDGIIDPKRHEAFVSKMRYGNALEMLERGGLRVRDELQNAATASAAVMQNRAQLLAQQRTQNADAFDSILRTKWTQVDGGNVQGAASPRDVFGRALSDPVAASGMAMRLNGQEGRVVADYTRETLANRFIKDGNIDAGEISKFLEDRDARKAAAAFLARGGGETPDQYFKKLEAVKEASERLASTAVSHSSTPPKLGIWDDALTQKIGFSFRQLINYTRASILGRVSTESLGTVLGAQVLDTIHKNHRNEVFKAIINDKTGKGLPLMEELLSGNLKGPEHSLRILGWMRENVPGFIASFMGSKHYPQLGRNAAVSINASMQQDREVQPAELVSP